MPGDGVQVQVRRDEAGDVGGLEDDACEAVAEVSPRVALVLKADIRPGWTGQMTAKVERVEARLRQAD